MNNKHSTLRKSNNKSPKCSCGRGSDYSIDGEWVCLVCRPLKTNQYHKKFYNYKVTNIKKACEIKLKAGITADLY